MPIRGGGGLVVHDKTYHQNSIIPAADQDFQGYRLKGLKRVTSVPSAADIGTDGIVLAELAGVPIENGTGDNSAYSTGWLNYLWAQSFVASASGTITQIQVNVKVNVGNIRLAIYADSGGAPGALLGETSSVAAASGWNVLDLLSSVTIVSGTTYHLAAQCSDNTCSIYYKAGITASYRNPYAYGAFPNPFARDGTSAFGVMNMKIEISGPLIHRLYANVNGTVMGFNADV